MGLALGNGKQHPFWSQTFPIPPFQTSSSLHQHSSIHLVFFISSTILIRPLPHSIQFSQLPCKSPIHSFRLQVHFFIQFSSQTTQKPLHLRPRPHHSILRQFFKSSSPLPFIFRPNVLLFPFFIQKSVQIPRKCASSSLPIPIFSPSTKCLLLLHLLFVFFAPIASSVSLLTTTIRSAPFVLFFNTKGLFLPSSVLLRALLALFSTFPPFEGMMKSPPRFFISANEAPLPHLLIFPFNFVPFIYEFAFL